MAKVLVFVLVAATLAHAEPVGYSPPSIDVVWTLVPLVGPPRAILKGPTLSYCVSEGDELGDYRVVKIEPGIVTFSFRARDYFRCGHDGLVSSWRRRSRNEVRQKL